MPLDKSGSKASVGRNIETEMAHGKPHDQAVAIALDVQRRSRVSPQKQESARNSILDTIKNVGAKVDSVMMSRMPPDFRRMFKRQPPKKTQ